MKPAALVIVVMLLGQTTRPSVRDLLNEPRSLTRDEIARVLEASRQKIAGKTLRLTRLPRGQTGAEILMGSGGHPKFVRYSGGIEGGTVSSDGTQTRWHDELIHLFQYTGRPARRCNGSTEPGELVVVYEHRRSTNAWTATARTTRWNVLLTRMFDLLTGGKPTTAGERKRIDGRWTRALVAPWTPPPVPDREPPVLIGDPLPNVNVEPAPNEATESLWIALDSLLPLQWEVRNRGSLIDGYTFRYEPMKLRPPANVAAPDCIP